MKKEELNKKIIEVLNVLKDLNGRDAKEVIRQSEYNLPAASTLNNIENFELELSAAK